MIRSLKKKYCSKKIEENKNDMKGTWKILIGNEQGKQCNNMY